MGKSRNSLTVRYSLHHALYWAATCGAVAFAATYLLDRGFTAAQTGWILFGANFGSFLLQPFLADRADRAKRNVIPGFMVMLALTSIVCFLTIRFIKPSLIIFAVLYLTANLCIDMQVPLLNSINVYYTLRSWKINYGVGRAAGGIGYAIVSYFIGFIIEDFGSDWVPVITVAFLALFAALCFTYPKTEHAPVESEAEGRAEAQEETSSLPQFFLKYGWYTASLAGVLFLALVHVMTENYLIEIVRRLGGDSSNVGIALVFATITELPAMVLFTRIKDRLGSYKVLLISGVSFVIKMVLFLIAKTVTAIYLIELMQVPTYVMLSAVQIYYAQECTGRADMVKGQSVITASYALGCALGNLLGGSLITAYGVEKMLVSAVVIASAGLATLALTVPRALRSGRMRKPSA